MEVFRILLSSIDPFHCTFIVGIVHLASTAGKKLLIRYIIIRYGTVT